MNFHHSSEWNPKLVNWWSISRSNISFSEKSYFLVAVHAKIERFSLFRKKKVKELSQQFFYRLFKVFYPEHKPDYTKFNRCLPSTPWNSRHNYSKCDQKVNWSDFEFWNIGNSFLGFGPSDMHQSDGKDHHWEMFDCNKTDFRVFHGSPHIWKSKPGYRTEKKVEYKAGYNL